MRHWKSECAKKKSHCNKGWLVPLSEEVENLKMADFFIEVETVHMAKSTNSNISENTLKKTISEGCTAPCFKSF